MYLVHAVQQDGEQFLSIVLPSARKFSMVAADEALEIWHC